MKYISLLSSTNVLQIALAITPLLVGKENNVRLRFAVPPRKAPQATDNRLTH